MSNFNPGLKPTSDPDYGRSSRPLELFNAEVRNKEADNNLITGIAKTVKEGVGIFDKAIQEGAKSELREGYEKLIGAQGVDLAAGNAVVNPENTVMNPLGDDKPPSNEQKFISEGMKRLTIARDQGKLSNSHYYAQLEALVREVKSRYPGYSEIIDRQIEGIAGVKPANALRQSLMHDMEKAEAAKQSKWDADQRFIEQNSDNLSAHDYQRWQKGELDDNSAKAIIQQRRANVQELQSKITDLNARSAQNRLSEDETKKGASDVAYSVHNIALDNVKTLAEQAQKEIEAGTFDPARYGTLLERARLDFKQTALQAIQKGVGNKLDVNQTNQIIEEAGKSFDDAAKIFTKEGSGSLNLLKTQIEALQNKDLLKVYNDPKVGVPLRSISAAQKAGGPEVAKMLANRFDQIGDLGAGIGNALSGSPSGGDPATKSDSVTKTLTFDNSTYMGLGDVAKGNPLQHIENLAKVGRANPTAIRMALNVWKDNLTNPSLGPDFAKNSAAILFGEGNKDFLAKAFKDQESRMEAYKMLTSPQVTQAMQKLKGTTEYDAYKDWAYNGFTTVLKGSVNRLQNVAERPYLDLKMNEESGHLELVPNKEGEEVAKQKWYNQSVPFNAATILENLLGKGLSNDVRSINQAIDNVRPILEGDKYKTGDQLRNLMGALAKAAPQEKKGLWNWISKSIQLPDKSPDDLEFGGKHPNFTQASGNEEDPRSIYKANLRLVDTYDPKTASQVLMDMIAKGESNANYNRLVDTPTHPKEAPLTDMTIKEVLDYQKGMIKAGNASSAAGKYQIVGTTLKSLVDKGVVSLTDKYDKATQDKLANALLEGRGYKDYLEGRKSLRQFMHDLGNEWEIIKVDPGLARRVASELSSQKLAYSE